jgi:hypothetical protein
MASSFPVVFLLPLVLLSGASRADAAGSLRAEVPFEIGGNRILLKGVTIGDVPDQVVVFDSGAGSTGIFASEAERLGIVPDGEAEALGAGGRTTVRTTSGGRVSFGDVVLSDLTLYHFRRPATPPGGGPRIAGIIGYDLLKDHVVRVDFDRRMLEIHEPRRYRRANAGQSLPLVVRRRTPGLRATIVLPGGETATDEFGLDLGAPYALHLDSTFVARHRLLDDRAGLVRRTLMGVGPTPLVAYEGRIPEFRVGRSSRRDVPVLFHDASPEVFRTDGRIGVLGMAFLDRFNLVFDYGRHRIELEPNGSFEAPFAVRSASRAVAAAAGHPGAEARTVQMTKEDGR